MPNQLDLRSEEIQEVIEKMPPAITNWGTAALLIVMLSLLGLSYFVKVPEQIRGQFQATINEGGELLVGHDQSGLIKSGQKIILELDNYPSSTFGNFICWVDSIGLNAEKDAYRVFTSRIKAERSEIIFAPSLPFVQGEGSIILEEKRLLAKIWPFTERLLHP